MRTASRAAQRLPCDFRQIGDRVWERHIRQWKATGTRRRSSFDSRWGFHRRGGDIPWEKRPLNQSGEASSRFSSDNQARRRLLRNRERATTYGAESVGRNFWESQVSSIGARRRIWPSKRQFWNRHGSSVGFQGGKKRRLTEVGGGDFLSVPIITDEFVIESKFFQFKVIDSASIRISETKEGISSILDLDFARLTWLKDSIIKIFSDNKSCSKLELNKSLIVRYDENYFGGFIQIIEKGSDSLFIPEGWNGQGIHLFLTGIGKTIASLKEIAAKSQAVGHTSGKVFSDGVASNDLEFLPFDGNNLYCDTGTSISGALLQVDIDSFNHSSDLVSVDDVRSGEHIPDSDALLELKEFFQVTLTNGVDSLSHFLLYEIEKLLAAALGNRDNLLIKPIDDGKPSRMQNDSGKVDENKIGVLESRNIGIGGDHTDFCWDYANLDCIGNLNANFEEDFGGSYSTHSGDEFLGHVSENEKRVPISTVDDLWDSDTNEVICQKALLVTRDNCLPTQNLNTQKRMYKKKNQRSHLMRTRSQTRAGL